MLKERKGRKFWPQRTDGLETSQLVIKKGRPRWWFGPDGCEHDANCTTNKVNELGK